MKPLSIILLLIYSFYGLWQSGKGKASDFLIVSGFVAAILGFCILVSSCTLTPEQRAAVGYGLAAGMACSSNNWNRVAAEQAYINNYWTNYRYQQNQLMLMQQQNMILQQQRCP